MLPHPTLSQRERVKEDEPFCRQGAFSTKNLLIVDDSATTRMLISLTLKKSGSYRIVEASDGADAVEKLGSQASISLTSGLK